MMRKEIEQIIARAEEFHLDEKWLNDHVMWYGRTGAWAPGTVWEFTKGNIVVRLEHIGEDVFNVTHMLSLIVDGKYYGLYPFESESLLSKFENLYNGVALARPVAIPIDFGD